MEASPEQLSVKIASPRLLRARFPQRGIPRFRLDGWLVGYWTRLVRLGAKGYILAFDRMYFLVDEIQRAIRACMLDRSVAILGGMQAPATTVPTASGEGSSDAPTLLGRGDGARWTWTL
jgi:hypothetical protein